jgi:hypothetical protein
MISLLGCVSLASREVPMSANIQAQAQGNDEVLDDQRVMDLALGRILRMGSRPTQPGDEAEFDRCRNIFMEAAERRGYNARANASIGNLMPGWNFGNRSID